MTDTLCIPSQMELDLWAKVIIAKNIQTDEPILGTYDEYGEPLPYVVKVTCLDEDETVVCINDFKVEFDAANVTEDFICTSKVIVSIPFKAFLWIKTTKGYKCVKICEWIFKKTIPLSEFKKLDGTPITQQEFKDEVDQSKVVVKDYQLEFINILEKGQDLTKQKIEIIISATIIDKLGKYKDVIVFGYIPKE